MTSILEDADGYVWIATSAGVDRFDGRKIKNYRLYDSDIIYEGKLLFYVMKDGEGNLWACASSGKVYRYNRLFDCFELKADFGRLLGRYIFVNHVYIDRQGTFWISAMQGLYKYNAEDGIETIFNGLYVNSTLEYKGDIYAATVKGVYKYNISTKKKLHLFPGKHVLTLHADRRTALLWMGTFDEGVYVFDLEHSRLRQTKAADILPKYPCRSIVQHTGSALLMGFDGKGIYYVDGNGTDVRHVLYSEQPYGLLKDNGVYCIYNDRAGNIWIGTYGTGIHYFVPKKFPYQLFRHTPNNQQSLCNSNVNRVMEDSEDNLWFATNSGISVLWKNTGKWSHFFPRQVILTLCDDKNGHVWAGGYGCGLYRINIKDGAYKWFSHKKDRMVSTDYIYSIVRDPSGELWIGGIYGALTRYNPRTGAYTYYKEITMLNSIEVVNANTIAVATSPGFYLIEKTRAKSSTSSVILPTPG